MKTNTILLISGAVLTLLFIIFSAPIFEMLYYEREFSNEMYNENLYMVVALVTSVVAWALAAVFYYVINSVSFSRWYHWLIVLLVASVLAPVINYAYPNSIFSELDYDFSAQLYGFCLVDMMLEAVFFIIASFSMRWWSANCRHTPIPE